MRYALCTTLGIGLLAAAFTLLAYGTYEIAQIGVCAGGPQPFEVQRECPSGTTGLVLAMFGAFPLMGVGALLHSARGRAPGSGREPAQITFLIFWFGLFGALSFASLWSVWGPDADPGGLTGTTATTKPAAIGIGIMFALMALPVLPVIGSRLLELRAGGGDAAANALGGGGSATSFATPARHSPRSSSGSTVGTEPTGSAGGTTLGDLIASATAAGSTGGGSLERLERLEALRGAGTISDVEFERLKREIIEGGGR